VSLQEQIDSSKWRSLEELDVAYMLEHWASREPDKGLMVWEPFEGAPRQWSYKRVSEDARRIARGLSDRGVKPGDFVILHLENSPEFVLAWFACAYLGAVAVSTNTRSVARDLSYFAEHTEAVCAITQPQFAELIASACPDLGWLAVTDNDAGKPADNLSTEAVPFDDLYADEPIALRSPDPTANLSVQFTSGTTSRPKAVLWTHANGLWAAKIGAAHLRLRADDRTLIFMPLFHTNAQGWSMLPTVWSGGTFVLQPKFSASRFWDLSLKYALTWLSIIPFASKAILNQPVPDHSYRVWGLGAQAESLAKHFKVTVLGWWGMTETLTQGIISDCDQPGPNGSMGRVAPEYDIEIRHEEGRLARLGERGVLHIRGVRGVTLFKEYYRNIEANEQAFDDNGWFNTGDIVRIDEAGYLYFSDRDKDMLKVGAENVAASEIEVVIMQTGLASECAVVAQKHYMLDEVPVAFVIPSGAGTEQDRDAILGRCRSDLADFKVPRDVLFVDELPRSTLEKVAKAELRARLAPIEH